MKVINDKKRLLFTLKEKTSGTLVVAPEELILVEENNIKEDSDIIEVANLSALPATGEVAKIYITIDTNLQYRWTGSAYVQIGAEKPFEIMDVVESAEVASAIPTLIKSYDVGSLSGFKTLSYKIITKRTGINNESMKLVVYLKDKNSSTTYLLGKYTSFTTANRGFTTREVIIQETSSTIQTLINDTEIVSDQFDNGGVDSITTIDFSKEYEIQVFGSLGWGATAKFRTYFTNIIKR